MPGGAGLVARLEEKEILHACLEAALGRVNGGCGCGKNDNCYGCLRSYRNQFAHQHLKRGPVMHYLRTLLEDWKDWNMCSEYNEGTKPKSLSSMLLASYGIILLSWYSTILVAPATFSFGIISRTTFSSIITSRAYYPLSEEALAKVLNCHPELVEGWYNHLIYSHSSTGSLWQKSFF